MMIANMSAFALARHWRPIPVYEALLLQDGIELPHGSRPLDPPSAAQIEADEPTMDATA
jgi:chloride channel protein, CIC family